MLSNLKTSRQRESKLGLQTADNGIRYDHTKLAHRFQTKTISHTFLDLFWRVYPLYQPVRVEENTKSFVIWDNIKTLAIYVLILLGYWDGIQETFSRQYEHSGLLCNKNLDLFQSFILLITKGFKIHLEPCLVPTPLEKG